MTAQTKHCHLSHSTKSRHTVSSRTVSIHRHFLHIPLRLPHSATSPMSDVSILFSHRNLSLQINMFNSSTLNGLLSRSIFKRLHKPFGKLCGKYVICFQLGQFTITCLGLLRWEMSGVIQMIYPRIIAYTVSIRMITKFSRYQWVGPVRLVYLIVPGPPW